MFSYMVDILNKAARRIKDTWESLRDKLYGSSNSGPIIDEVTPEEIVSESMMESLSDLGIAKKGKSPVLSTLAIYLKIEAEALSQQFLNAETSELELVNSNF